MRARRLGLGTGLGLGLGLAVGFTILGPTAARAERFVVSVEGAPPNRTLEFEAPALGVNAVRATADAMGTVHLALEVANLGKARLAVRREQCASGERLSLVAPGGTAHPPRTRCKRVLGPPFVLDPSLAPAGSDARVTIGYQSLRATTSWTPKIAGGSGPTGGRPPARALAPTRITVLDAQGAMVIGAKVFVTGLTPGLPAESVTVATDQQGAAAFRLEPGRYHWEIQADGFQVSRGTKEIVAGDNAIAVSLTVAPAREVPTTTSSTSTAEGLDVVPSYRDPWALLQQTPGVLLDRIHVSVGPGSESTDFTMTGSGNLFEDSLNGLPYGRQENTESVETQNGVLDFHGQATGFGLEISSGLGEFQLGRSSKLSLGGGLSVRQVGLTFDYDLVDPSATDVRDTRWEADGRLYELGVGAALSVPQLHDRLWTFVSVRAGWADLGAATRSPALGGDGITVLQDEARFEASTLVFTAGMCWAATDWAVTAGVRRTMLDVTLTGDGAIEARAGSQTLRRVFSFENVFEGNSLQLIAGVEARVWQGLTASAFASLGSGASSLGVNLGYLVRR